LYALSSCLAIVGRHQVPIVLVGRPALACRQHLSLCVRMRRGIFAQLPRPERAGAESQVAARFGRDRRQMRIPVSCMAVVLDAPFREKLIRTFWGLSRIM
jgi:hypothetical protein